MQIANFPLRLDHDPACVFNVVERFALFLPVNASSSPGKAGYSFSDLSLTPQVKSTCEIRSATGWHKYPAVAGSSPDMMCDAFSLQL